MTSHSLETKRGVSLQQIRLPRVGFAQAEQEELHLMRTLYAILSSPRNRHYCYHISPALPNEVKKLWRTRMKGSARFFGSPS